MHDRSDRSHCCDGLNHVMALLTREVRPSRDLTKQRGDISACFV